MEVVSEELADSGLRELMERVNQVLEEEIPTDWVQLGETYFARGRSAVQTLLDIEPVVYDLLPMWLPEKERRVGRKELMRRIWGRIQKEFGGIK